MNCQCGSENAAEARFCRSCGRPLTDAPRPEASDSTARSRGSLTPLRATAIVLVATIGAGAYWFLNRPPDRYVTDNGGLFLIDVDGKSGFMNASGEVKIAPQFDAARGFSEGKAAVRVGDKWGFVDTTGTLVITPQFEDVQDFRSGRAAVKVCCGGMGFQEASQNRFGIIDEEGKYVGTPDLKWVGSAGFNGELAPPVGGPGCGRMRPDPSASL